MSRKPVGQPKSVLESPIEQETRARTAAFRLLITRAEPIEPPTLAEVMGISPDRVAALIDRLDHAGRIRRDGAGRLVGSAGLSVTPDRHEIELEGRQFWTWCAYDILGIFGALRASGRALSPSPSDRAVIEVGFVEGRPQPSTAVLFRPNAELMECCDNVYADWCPNSNLFASRKLAEAWAAEHHLSGEVLNLEEAADIATQGWEPLTTGLALKGDRRFHAGRAD